MRTLLSSLLLLLSLATPLAWSNSDPHTRQAAWATPLDARLNLYRMDQGLYRSALPQAGDQPLLQQLGVKTVINFYQRSDAQWLNAPGIHQVHLPLRTDRIDDADVLAVLRSIRQAQAYGPVLIHCKHGQHRTGLIAALYRVVYQGWSKPQALAEMRGGGFGGEERLADAEAYLQGVDINALHRALASGACSTSPWALCSISSWLNHQLAWR